jgi:hypothetical protein
MKLFTLGSFMKNYKSSTNIWATFFRTSKSYYKHRIAYFSPPLIGENTFWVHFGRPCKEKYWYILWLFGIFHSAVLDLMAFWYIFPVLVCCTKKNLATLVPASDWSRQT